MAKKLKNAHEFLNTPYHESLKWIKSTGTTKQKHERKLFGKRSGFYGCYWSMLLPLYALLLS